jgi:flagellar biosynthetic protein FliS
MTDANAGSQAYRGYIESGILSAHPVEIVHMLYRVAIDNLNAAIAHLVEGDNSGRSRAVSKAQQAVHELMFALDRTAGGSISRNLAELYDYVQRQIIAGHTQRSEQAFRDALAVLTTLSEGWSGVRANLMGGSQAAEGDSLAVPDEQPETAPGTGISHLYAAPVRDPATAQDWSC